MPGPPEVARWAGTFGKINFIASQIASHEDVVCFFHIGKGADGGSGHFCHFCGSEAHDFFQVARDGGPGKFHRHFFLATQ